MANIGKLEHLGFREGVFVPLAQSVLVGFLGGTGIGTLMVATKNGDVAWVWGLTAFLILTMFEMMLSFNNLDKLRELVARGGQTLPVATTQKAFDSQPMIVEMIARTPNRGDIWKDLPVSKEQLYALSVGMIENHARFKVGYWGGGEVFREKQFDKLVDLMVSKKYAEWKNTAHRNLGVRLTEDGCVWIESIYCHYYKEKYNKLPHPIPRLDRGV